MNRTLATTSMALGIAAVPALFLFALGLPLGLAAAMTGAVALARGEDRPGRDRRRRPLIIRADS